MKKSFKIILATVTIVLTLVTFAVNAFALNSQFSPGLPVTSHNNPYLCMRVAIQNNSDNTFEMHTFQASTYVDDDGVGIANDFTHDVPGTGYIREYIYTAEDLDTYEVLGHHYEYEMTLLGGSPTGTFTQEYFMGNYLADVNFVEAILPWYYNTRVSIQYNISFHDKKGIIRSLIGTRTVERHGNDNTFQFVIPVEEGALNYVDCAYIKLSYTNDDMDLFYDNTYLCSFYLPRHDAVEMNEYLDEVVSSSRDFSVTGFLASSLTDFFGADLFGNISLGEIFFALIGLLCIIAFLKYIAGG